MNINFRKFEKKFKFNNKIAKSEVIKILITFPIALKTMQQLNIKPWRAPWDPGAGKKFKKI